MENLSIHAFSNMFGINYKLTKKLLDKGYLQGEMKGRVTLINMDALFESARAKKLTPEEFVLGAAYYKPAPVMKATGQRGGWNKGLKMRTRTEIEREKELREIEDRADKVYEEMQNNNSQDSPAQQSYSEYYMAKIDGNVSEDELNRLRQQYHSFHYFGKAPGDLTTEELDYIQEMIRRSSLPYKEWARLPIQPLLKSCIIHKGT